MFSVIHTTRGAQKGLIVFALAFLGHALEIAEKARPAQCPSTPGDTLPESTHRDCGRVFAYIHHIRFHNRPIPL